MSVWRKLLILSFLLLGGCLATFEQPLPGTQPAPKALLGHWSSKDGWGEPVDLVINALPNDVYRAKVRLHGKPAHSYTFTASRHGGRWYASSVQPDARGALIGGFELIENRQLVIYTLDVELLRQAITHQELSGRTTTVGQDEVPGAHIDSPAERVMAYLDDPANSDVFVEAARLQRVAR